MKRFIFVLGFLVLVAPLHAQEQKPAAAPANGETAAAAPAVVITDKSTPTEPARAAFIAQGGEKFRSVQNMVMRGSVQLYPPNSVQSIPGSFSLVTAGPKLRMDIDARPAIVFKQIYDGQNSYSSMPNVEMPPLTKYGLGALGGYDQAGYRTTGLRNKKSQLPFRFADPNANTPNSPTDARTVE